MARPWPKEEGWALGRVERVGLLYQANEARLKVRREPAAFARKDGQLRSSVREMARQAEAELADPGIHPARQKVLQSLRGHWDGLSVFVGHPGVPMGNNTAERVQRGAVVLRKNSYGSGSVWAGELAAMLLGVSQALCLRDVNPRAWLSDYLQECARAGGRAPEDLGAFLPWQMGQQRGRQWSLSAGADPDDSS